MIDTSSNLASGASKPLGRCYKLAEEPLGDALMELAADWASSLKGSTTDEYEGDGDDVKRELPFETMNYGKRKRQLPFETLNYGKRSTWPKLRYIERKRNGLPFESILLGKRSLPFETLNYGKRAAYIPIDGYIMGKRGEE